MATNPMQRKARNSFLLGMLLMLIISAVIVAFLLLQVVNMKKAEEKTKKLSKAVYVLNEDVKSGGVIVLDKGEDSKSEDNISISIKQETVIGTAVAPNAINPNYISEVKADSDGVTRVYAKIAMKAGTILTQDMIYINEEEKIQDNVRKQEFNMIILPTQLTTGDYIDIRLMLSTGEDYIVVSKKKVEIPDVGGTNSEDTIWINLTEEEILTMSNAIYEAFTLPGSKLYATLYTDPGIQQAASPTYPIKASILKIINGDPNVVKEAKEALRERYNDTLVGQRNEVINPALNDAGQQGETNLQTKMEESIKNTQKERKDWLDSLGATVEESSSTTTTTTNSTE